MPISLTHRDKLRTSLAQAACSEFFANGYAAASVDSIVKMAGGSKSKIYSYFGNKEQLFCTIITEKCHEILEPLQSLQLTDHDLPEALELFGITFLTSILSPEAIKLSRLVIAESYRFPQLGQVFMEAGPNHAHRVLGKYLARTMASNDADLSIAPEAMATMFIDMISRNFQLKLLLGVDQDYSQSELKKTVQEAIALIHSRTLQKNRRLKNGK